MSAVELMPMPENSFYHRTGHHIFHSMFHKRREANLATHYTSYNPLSGCTSPVNYAGLPVVGATCPKFTRNTIPAPLHPTILRMESSFLWSPRVCLTSVEPINTPFIYAAHKRRGNSLNRIKSSLFFTLGQYDKNFFIKLRQQFTRDAHYPPEYKALNIKVSLSTYTVARLSLSLP
jgi:hypothetical protein